jgi:NADPH:quinone reductase
VKAILIDEIGSHKNARLGDAPEPVPGPDELLVDLRAADINFPDLLTIEGLYQVRPPLPFVPGKGGAGVVAAVGEGVSGFSPGDRVLVEVEYGTFAERVAAPAVNCFHLPDGMPFDEAAVFGLVYQTGYFALKVRAQQQPGEVVLVFGASGGVGIAAIQLAKAFGGTVIAATRGEAGRDIVKAAGADHIVDAAMDDLHNGLRDAVQGMTDGHGVDVVFDPVGGAASGASLRTLAWCGRLVIIGFAAGDIPSIPANYLLLKNISAIGLNWAEYRNREKEAMHEAQSALFGLYRDQGLRPLITERFTLDEFGTAMGRLKDGSVRGKMVFEID